MVFAFISWFGFILLRDLVGFVCCGLVVVGWLLLVGCGCLVVVVCVLLVVYVDLLFL